MTLFTEGSLFRREFENEAQLKRNEICLEVYLQSKVICKVLTVLRYRNFWVII